MTGLFFGLTTVDLQFLVDTYPESNSKVKATKNGIYAGGPATNAAISFAFLGGNSKLYTVIGKHQLSNFLRDDIQSAGVELHDVAADERVEPVFASIITSNTSGERTVFSYHPQQRISEISLEQFSFNVPDIAMFDGFYLDSAILLAQHLHQKQVPVVMDGGSWKAGLEEFLPLVDVAICSEDFYPPNITHTKQVINYLKNQGIENIAITRGEKPIIFESPDQSGEIYISQKKIVDSLGAGDFFHGAFCFFFSKGDGFVEALRKSAEVATRSCMEFGTREWMNKDV